MVATAHVLRARPESIGSFLRVGHTGYRKLESLIAASRLRFRDSYSPRLNIEGQGDLLGTLRRSGCEILLDPNLAETAKRQGGFQKSSSPDGVIIVAAKQRLI
jgi:hypothetical protein